MHGFESRTLALVGAFALLCGLSGLTPRVYAQPGAAESSSSGTRTSPRDDSGAQAFRDAAVSPPPGWQGRVFRLSRDYPARLPATCTDCGWLAKDLTVVFQPIFPAPAPTPARWTQGGWATYMQRILDYV